MRVFTAVAAAALLSLTSAALAQRQTLKVGNPAPGLDVEKWVKGEETTIEKDRVYVVEFWATWCRPCIQSIPHLSELQERYATDGLTIIGVSTDDETTQDKVEPFVRKMGTRMEYVVAMDNRGATKRNWFDAAGLEGIPAAFIVDQKGIIQFIGHPMSDEFEQVLGLVVDGRYDARLFGQMKPVRDALETTRKQRNWKLYFRHIDELIASDKRIFAPFVIEKFEVMLLDMNDSKAAYEYAGTIMQEFSDDPTLLVSLARFITTDPSVPDEKRDNDVAMALTEVALENTTPRDKPKVRAVQARIHFNRGEMAKAVALQKQAYVEVDTRLKAQYNRTLRKYMEAQQRSQVGSR